MRAGMAAIAGWVLSAAAAPPPAPDPGDWPRYARDLAGTRFSPLDQITAANVGRLAPAWRFRVRPGGGGSVVSSATPIAIAGILYLPVGDAVVALDGATGRELWRHPVEGGAARRTVSWWPGDGTAGPRLFYSTGRAIVALDPATGEVDRGFAAGGSLALDVPYNGPPTVWRDVLVVGANTAEMPRGEPGDTRAFDARTGAPLWRFHTVPRPGERGHRTWRGNGWKGRSGTNVWVWYMTLDAATGTLFMTVGGPSPNYYGGDRPGANLFGNSVVALDAGTGRLRWWFQTIHHDLWDQDLPAPPVLIDLRVGRRAVPALAVTGKRSLMYILDRHTGRPVFGVREAPAARGDVPGEWYAPTQPIPARPQPLSRVAWTPADIVTDMDTSAGHAAACRALLARYGGFYNAGPFTPFFLHAEGGPVKASINLPQNGGSNWGGSAADPRGGIVYVNTSEGASIGFIERRKAGADYGRGAEGSTQAYDKASLDGPGGYATFSAPFKGADGRTTTLPCIRPPWGRLVAVDANTGRIAWAVPLGVSDELPPGRQATGRLNSFGGPIVTAGGLVFIGATDDRRFRAFDARTGRELWSSRLDYNAQAVPITYRGRDGRQYVAVTAASFGAGARGPDGKPLNEEALVAFALPKED